MVAVTEARSSQEPAMLVITFAGLGKLGSPGLMSLFCIPVLVLLSFPAPGPTQC